MYMKGGSQVAKLFSVCPICKGRLEISTLKCGQCGVEMKNDFELSPFDRLSEEQMEFLCLFLKSKGSFKAVQEQMGLSYPAAQKRFGALLVELGLIDDTTKPGESEEVDMTNWSGLETSKKASDIIKKKLMEHNGRVVVYTARGLPSEIRMAPDGMSFFSDKLPTSPLYRYEVFDVIVDLLISQGGRALKGNGRNYKLGDSDCDETTVVGIIGYRYANKETGASVFDPVFVLAAILEWAGIAHNCRGYIELTAEYREMRGV